MGKQKKKKVIGTNRDEPLDKPDYALDTIKEPKKPKKPTVKETDVFVEERLNQKALRDLTKMKEQLLAAKDAETEKKDIHKKRTVKKSAKDKIADDPNMSFADLFDPADDDDQSFEDMLTESKLDWRKFKD